MYELLKALAEANNWVFEYGRRDFQNLYNEVTDPKKVHLFLDPIQITNNYGDYNEIDTVTYSGSMMFLKRSELGEGYMERYQEHIKPFLNSQVEMVREAIFQEEIAINSLRTTEVINMFDYGFDGIVINYSLTDSTI